MNSSGRWGKPGCSWRSAACPPQVLWGGRFVGSRFAGHGGALRESEGWQGTGRVETEGLLDPQGEWVGCGLAGMAVVPSEQRWRWGLG